MILYNFHKAKKKNYKYFLKNLADGGQSKYNFLIQWTITKIGVNLLGSKGADEVKVAFELEDIISSVDKQSTYMKVKTKIGSMNGIREIKNHLDPTPQSIDALTVLSRSDTIVDNAQETFFELVATKAITHNVHNRWGAKKVLLGNGVHDDTITEIMITMQSIDVKLELDMLSTVLPILSSISADAGTSNYSTGIAERHRSSLCVRDIPLVFFNCKGFQMWIPTSSSVDQSDVLILKVYNTCGISSKFHKLSILKILQ